jgi:hypothetical protein
MWGNVWVVWDWCIFCCWDGFVDWVVVLFCDGGW